VSLVQVGSAPFDPEHGPPCHRCTARCCKYFALEIDPPRTPKEHDYIRWYLLHQHVVVWKQGREWFLEVRTPCRHLQPDNSCGIYESRPQICREYGWPDKDAPEEDPCEYFSPETGYDLFFDSAEAFDAWSRPALLKRERRLAERRARAAARRSRDTKAIA